MKRHGSWSCANSALFFSMVSQGNKPGVFWRLSISDALYLPYGAGYYHDFLDRLLDHILFRQLFSVIGGNPAKRTLFECKNIVVGTFSIGRQVAAFSLFIVRHCLYV